MKKVEISVVIPVYNSEKFISDCLESILKQSYKNYEIICVNDGSTDGSEKIILKYKKNSKNTIKLINQENKGSGAARNTGIENAVGEYIVFIDSDDTIDPLMLEKLYKSIKIKNSDIAVCGFKRVDEKTNKVLSVDMVSQNYEVIDIEADNIEKFLFINPGPCNKLHKRSLFNDARFAEIPVVDDLMLMLKYFPKVKRISFVNEPLYYYKYRRNSSSNSLSYDTFCKLKDHMINMKKSYIKNNYKKIYLEFIDKIAFIHIGISMFTKLSYRKEIKLFKEIRKTKKYLNENFQSWDKLYLRDSIKNKNIRHFYLYILMILYKVNLFILFIKFYKFLNDVIKKDIKW